jgi:hypothetical protein
VPHRDLPPGSGYQLQSVSIPPGSTLRDHCVSTTSRDAVGAEPQNAHKSGLKSSRHQGLAQPPDVEGFERDQRWRGIVRWDMVYESGGICEVG